jgi:hypothetical protein
MSPEKAREKATAFFWDDNFMHEYYKQYSFREVTERDIEIIKEYFRSDSWREAYRIMTDEYAGIIHSHALVETSKVDPIVKTRDEKFLSVEYLSLYGDIRK